MRLIHFHMCGNSDFLVLVTAFLEPEHLGKAGQMENGKWRDGDYCRLLPLGRCYLGSLQLRPPMEKCGFGKPLLVCGVAPIIIHHP